MSTIDIILFYFIGFISVAGSFLIMPYISRKNISFGVTIPEAEYYCEEIKSIRKQYRNLGLLLSLAVTLLTIILSHIINTSGIEYLFVTGAMIINMILFGILYLNAYGLMKS